MIISITAEKSLDKIQHLFMVASVFKAILYYFVYMPYLVYPFALVVNATMNISVPISFLVPAFSPLSIYPDVELIDPTLVLGLSFSRMAILFSTVAEPSYFISFTVNNTAVYGCIPFCLPTDPLMDIRFVSPIGYCEQCSHQCVVTSAIISLGFISRSAVVEPCVNCIFIVLT